VRVAFFVLVIANLAFLAWAEWIDAPQPAPANEAYAKLPRLKLVNELPASDARPSSDGGTARKGEISKGFWVYIGGLKSDSEVADVLRTLEQSHVEDAHLMSDAGDAHQVSVGLFSERERADRRAQSVEKLGLHPTVAERKLPATLFWMDVDLPPGAADPTAQDVVAQSAQATPVAGQSSRVQVAPCPASPALEATPASAPAVPFRTKVAGATPAPKVP
jgi:hypothetical protein